MSDTKIHMAFGPRHRLRSVFTENESVRIVCDLLRPHHDHDDVVWEFLATKDGAVEICLEDCWQTIRQPIGEDDD